ncbi:MAG: hypothetical protein RIB80_07405 [Rhodospirillales bacterium]
MKRIKGPDTPVHHTARSQNFQGRWRLGLSVAQFPNTDRLIDFTDHRFPYFETIDHRRMDGMDLRVERTTNKRESNQDPSHMRAPCDLLPPIIRA